MSKYHDAAEVWEHKMAYGRELLANLVPKALINYPFEVIASFLGLVIGLPLLIGLAAPTSLVVLLPSFGYWAYASALVIGGATAAVGLRTRHPLVLASGLQLLGGSYIVYGLAVVALSGFTVAWLSFGAYLAFGGLCMIRALHFRRVVDIQRGATALRERGTT